MKKKIYGKKLGRSTTARRALARGLMVKLIDYGLIKTTKAKANFLQSKAEKLVSLAGKNNSFSMKQVYSLLGNDKERTKKLIKEIYPSFLGKKSGFTRVINLPSRKGDNAQMARIEWSVNVKPPEVSNKKKNEAKVEKPVRKTIGKLSLLRKNKKK